MGRLIEISAERRISSSAEKNMNYEEDGGLEEGFKINDDDEEPLEMPENLDFGLDEEDPDKDR